MSCRPGRLVRNEVFNSVALLNPGYRVPFLVRDVVRRETWSDAVTDAKMQTRLQLRAEDRYGL